ncbi:MAG: cytochrome c [Vicinamibacterales bacterium]
MRRFLKWLAIVVAVVAVAAFLAFLYFIPPFDATTPEGYSQIVREGTPGVDGVTDPAERAIAERGRTIVMTTGCIGCHAAPGPEGPDYSRFLAGGALKITSREGVFVSRNLTPDTETGLGRRTDDEVKRVLRSGVFPDGHVVPYTSMPWALFSHWSEEDRHAVVVYLRSLKPIRRAIPEPGQPVDLPSSVIERDYGFKDYGVN